MEDNTTSHHPGLVIDQNDLLYTAEEGVEYPGTGMTDDELHEWAMILDLVNEASATTAPTSQPADMAKALSDSTDTSDCDNDEGPGFLEPSYRYSLGRSYANSRHPHDMDNCTVYKQFKRLPRHIRSQIWKFAAQAAKAGIPMVFDFTYEKMALNAGTQYSQQLSQSLFDHANLIRPGDQLVRDIRELMRQKHDGDSILTLTPFLDMADATLEIRNILRCCPEARRLLLRDPRLSSCFNFHWITRFGKINLGTIRPFCYDTDWITLVGLDYPLGSSELGFGRPGDQGVRCTPDLARIQHFAFPYDSAPKDNYVIEPVMQLLLRKNKVIPPP